ncbi:hypothetical protein Bca4012_043960 [Brassica carinata]
MDELSIIPLWKVIGAEKKEIQGLLKAVVQSVGWTYSVFWQLCPQRRKLLWSSGNYNGAIKTRKTTQPAEVTAEEAASERSQQLMELYETLFAGESSMEARACTALSPEDLTDPEWMPGKAYARRKHIWLSGANEVDNKIFSRAISAKVKESEEFVDHIKSFFHNYPKSNTKPTLSEHFINEEREEDEDEVEEEEMTMSEEIRLGSPDDDDVSNQNLLSDFHIEATNSLDTHMDMMNLMEEGGNYSQTVSTLLMSQPTSLLSDSVSTSSYVQSSFISWRVENVKEHQQYQRVEKAASSSSQWMLKHIILKVPFLHDNTKNKRLPREELNHVVAERRRREKLNERFITLRSLVPFVTKMDKVSILGDTIEYVNHLSKRIHELESTHHEPNQKRMRIGKGRTWEEVEVSIIESDVLLEMRCEYRDGLLLNILQVLKELGIETTAVHTALNDHHFEAEIRAKVRGKKPTIAEVKIAIHQIIYNNKL